MHGLLAVGSGFVLTGGLKVSGFPRMMRTGGPINRCGILRARTAGEPYDKQLPSSRASGIRLDYQVGSEANEVIALRRARHG